MMDRSFLLALLLLLAGTILSGCLPKGRDPVVTNGGDLWLTSEKRPRIGTPVDWVADVLFADDEWELLFVHDARGVHYVSPPWPTETGITAGDRIRLTGQVASGVAIDSLRIEKLASGHLPDASSTTLSAIADPGVEAQSEWVQVEATEIGRASCRERGWMPKGAA